MRWQTVAHFRRFLTVLKHSTIGGKFPPLPIALLYNVKRKIVICKTCFRFENDTPLMLNHEFLRIKLHAHIQLLYVDVEDKKHTFKLQYLHAYIGKHTNGIVENSYIQSLYK
jgi:hypothetical protein